MKIIRLDQPMGQTVPPGPHLIINPNRFIMQDDNMGHIIFIFGDRLWPALPKLFVINSPYATLFEPYDMP